MTWEAYALCWKKKVNNIFQRKYYVFLLLIPLGSIYIAVHEFFSKEGTNAAFSVITFSVLLLINIAVFECYSKLADIFEYENEKNMYLQQIDMISKNTEEQKTIMEEFREERHNLINELIVLKDRVEQQDMESAIETINQMIQVCDNGERISNCGNSVVDAIINYKYIFAKEHEIRFRMKIFIPPKLPINQCAIGVILGNALDNAIDAVKQCRDHEKVIDISMGIKKEALVLVVKNPYEHELKRDRSGRFLTTKEDVGKHGYGLKSIRRVAKKYHGEVLVEAEDNIFQLTVVSYVGEI